MTNEKYKIREICGDWALDIPFPGSVFTIFFNSRVNAELVKKILIHEDEHPNEAVPFNPCTYTPANINREKWEPCQLCDSKCLTCMANETHKCRICKDYKYYLPLYQFCPKCGRPLTDEAWAELEKRLRGMMA